MAGEPWSPLIIRAVFAGINRFEDLQRDLGSLLGQINHVEPHCAACGGILNSTDVDFEPGPGYPATQTATEGVT